MKRLVLLLLVGIIGLYANAQTLVKAIFYPDTTIAAIYSVLPSTVDARNYILKTSAGVDITFGTATTNGDTVFLTDASGPIPEDGILDTLIDVTLSDTVKFYAGYVPINYLNTVNPDGTVLLDSIITIRGVVVADDDYRRVVIADAYGAYHSVFIYDASGNLPNNVSLGDSIVLMGYRTVYDGMTEFVPTKLFYKGLPKQLTITPIPIDRALLDTNVTQDDPKTELYEGCLVTIQNLIAVEGPTTYYEYVLGDSNKTIGVLMDDIFDYQYGDGLSLTIGHLYNITGIVVYSYGKYRICPRSKNDVVDVTPTPDMIEAFFYPSPDTSIVIVYNPPIPTSDVNAANYVLKTSSGVDITFGTAGYTSDGDTVGLGSPSTPIPDDDGKLDTLIDVVNNDTILLYAGFEPINYLNTASPNTVLNGMKITIKGVVVADNNYRHVIVADAEGAYHSVLIYDATGNFPQLVEPGDSIVVIGVRDVYYNMTEFIPGKLYYKGTPSSLTTINPTLIDPAIIDTATTTADDPDAEPYEAVLVKVENMVVKSGPDANYIYRLEDANQTIGIHVDDWFDYQYGDGLTLVVGHTYNITGVLIYTYGVYRIMPRGIGDVQEVITNVEQIDGVGIYPNPVDDYLNLAGIRQIMIFDNLGRLVKRAEVNGTGQINVSDLAPGIYTVKYVDNNGKVGVEKIIKK